MILDSKYFSKNIFLADDDEDDRDFFTQALKEVYADAIITEARNGNELMALLNQPPVPPPDVIFLDLNMPGKNGYECLNEIKSNKAMQNLPVVVFTTSRLQEDIERMYRLGATLYISKPGSFDRLKNVIRKAISVNWREMLQQPDLKNFVISA